MFVKTIVDQVFFHCMIYKTNVKRNPLHCNVIAEMQLFIVQQLFDISSAVAVTRMEWKDAPTSS